MPRIVREGPKLPWYSKPRTQPVQTEIAQNMFGEVGVEVKRMKFLLK